MALATQPTNGHDREGQDAPTPYKVRLMTQGKRVGITRLLKSARGRCYPSSLRLWERVWKWYSCAPDGSPPNFLHRYLVLGVLRLRNTSLVWRGSCFALQPFGCKLVWWWSMVDFDFTVPSFFCVSERGGVLLT